AAGRARRLLFQGSKSLEKRSLGSKLSYWMGAQRDWLQAPEKHDSSGSRAALCWGDARVQPASRVGSFEASRPRLSAVCRKLAQTRRARSSDKGCLVRK